jgi:hypothetical protein
VAQALIFRLLCGQVPGAALGAEPEPRPLARAVPALHAGARHPLHPNQPTRKKCRSWVRILPPPGPAVTKANELRWELSVGFAVAGLQVVDLSLLDVCSLHFFPSMIAAAACLLVTAEDDAELIGRCTVSMIEIKMMPKPKGGSGKESKAVTRKLSAVVRL